MIIKFADGEMLEIDSIRGATEYVQGTTRDVLSFFVSPDIIGVERLIEIFADKNKTKEIFEVDASGIVLNDIGKNYTIYVSVSNQQQENNVHGEYSGVDLSIMNIAKIAQTTYQEHLLEEIMAGR